MWIINLTATTCHIQLIHFPEFMSISVRRKQAKDDNTQSLPFVYDTKMAANELLGVPSINTEKASLSVL